MNYLRVFCPSLNQSSRLIILIFKHIGLIPFNIDCRDLKLHFENNQKRFSYKWILLTSGFFCAEIVIALIFRKRVFFTYYSVGLINDLLKHIAKLVAIYVSLVEVCFQRKYHIEMYERLVAGSDLNKLAFQLQKRNEFKQFFKRFSIKFLTYLCIVLLIEIQVILKVWNNSKQWRNVWLINFPIIFFIRLRVLYYIFHVDMIKAQLTTIQAEVRKASETMRWVKMIHIHSKEREAMVEKVVNSLIFLKQCYGEIWYIHFYLNNTSGWSVFFIIVCCFVQFSNHLYWLYLTFYERTIDGYGGM